MGSLRKRLPVAAKTALVTAGTTQEVPASPIPPGGSALRHDVDFDGGRFVHAQDAVVMEIALLDAALFDRDERHRALQ